MRRNGLIPPEQALTLLGAQVLLHEFVLGGEVAVEAHLIGTGLAGDGIDAYGVNAIAIEQIAGCLHDAITHSRLWGGRNNLFLYSYLRRLGSIHKDLHLTCELPVTNVWHKVTDRSLTGIASLCCSCKSSARRESPVGRNWPGRYFESLSELYVSLNSLTEQAQPSRLAADRARIGITLGSYWGDIVQAIDVIATISALGAIGGLPVLLNALT